MSSGPSIPIFYSFRRCPYAMRARLALASAGLQVELREIILRDKPAHMLHLSPKGTVPVLWLTNGQVIDESLDVMQWALEISDPEGLLDMPADTSARAQKLIADNDGPFKHHLDRYKYANRYEDADTLEHRQACGAYIEKLDRQLDNKAWLFGASPKFADFAILPFIRQFRIADSAWFDGQTQWSNVQNWLQNFLQSQRLADAMVKYDLWADGAAPIYFPPSAD